MYSGLEVHDSGDNIITFPYNRILWAHSPPSVTVQASYGCSKCDCVGCELFCIITMTRSIIRMVIFCNELITNDFWYILQDFRLMYALRNVYIICMYHFQVYSKQIGFWFGVNLHSFSDWFILLASRSVGCLDSSCCLQVHLSDVSRASYWSCTAARYKSFNQSLEFESLHC